MNLVSATACDAMGTCFSPEVKSDWYFNFYYVMLDEEGYYLEVGNEISAFYLDSMEKRAMDPGNFYLGVYAQNLSSGYDIVLDSVEIGTK